MSTIRCFIQKGLLRGSLLILLIGNMLPAFSQALELFNKDNGQLVNDSVLTVYSTDPNTLILTASFVMKNNTTEAMPVLLKRSINQIADSTIDFYCFSIQCWFGLDSVEIADTIPPEGESYTFVSHVCHTLFLELFPLIPGFSSITYTIFNPQAPPGTVEATVTVNYQLAAVGFESPDYKPVNVYPNPADDRLFAELPGSPAGEYTLRFFDAMGSLVSTQSSACNNGRVEIYSGDLPPGFYTGQISRGAGFVQNIKFIVSR